MKSYLLFFTFFMLIATSPTVFGIAVDSPLKQMKMGIDPQDVTCKPELTLMLRPSGDAVCVKPESVSVLIPRGWEAISSESSSSIEADIVFKNGSIYTVNADNPWAESIAITDKKISYVGDNDGAVDYVSENTKVIDLEGKMVLPGFHDSHTHPFDMVNALVRCNLFDLYDKELYLEQIRQCAEEQSDKQVVLGVGYWIPDYDFYSLTKYDLDEIIPNQPAVFMDVDGHSYWANSKMLETAGIDENTPDPPDGTIMRDPETGEPTGLLLSGAMNLISIDYWELESDEFNTGTREAFNMMSSSGITSFVEAMTFEGYEESFRELDEKGDLNFRVNLSLLVEPLRDRSQVNDLADQFSNDKYSHVRANMAKLFVDNIAEYETGALLEPYLSYEDGAPTDNYGELNFSQEDLNYYVTELEKAGFAIHMHAVGDKATRVALDALETSRDVNNLSGTRNTLAHIYLIHPDDIPRFAELEVMPNYQAFWAYKAEGWYEGIEASLGQERAESMFPLADLHETGSKIVIGSDWPVTTHEPLPAMEVGLTRQDPYDDTASWSVLDESQKLDLQTMIEAYTINGAYLMQQEDITGSIEVGKFADLVVLEKNLFEISPSEIGEVQVVMTFFEGKQVFNTKDS